MALKVLVVEDNAPSLRLFTDLLSARGHAVVSATCVAEARAVLEQPHVLDIALLDVQVPGGGGELILRDMRASAQHAAVPAVAVTALAMAGDKEKFLSLGFSAYISKPIAARTFGLDVERIASESVETAARSGP